jgi:hypothetical protein
MVISLKVTLSTGNFVGQLLFYQQEISSTRYFINFSFHQQGILSLNPIGSSAKHSSTKFQQWKRISREKNARWQHLSRLKASAFFSLQKKLVSCMKCNNLYSGLVSPSSG